MNELKSELDLQIKEVDLRRPVSSFKFELADVSRFFENDGDELFSEKFWCRGLQWSLKAKSNLDANSRCLGFYLYCESDDSIEWSCKVNYKLLLFNNLPWKRDNELQATKTFKKSVSEFWGYPNFISYAELIDERNGYIRNDKVVLGVQLKAEPVIRKG